MQKSPPHPVVGNAFIKRFYYADICEQPVFGQGLGQDAGHSFLAGFFFEDLPLFASAAVVTSKAIAKMEKNAFFILIFL
jgi:hypothetical protein